MRIMWQAYPTINEITVLSSGWLYDTKILEESAETVKYEITIDPYTYDTHFISEELDEINVPDVWNQVVTYFFWRLKKITERLREDDIVLYFRKKKGLWWSNIHQNDIQVFINRYNRWPQWIEEISNIFNQECWVYEIVINKEKYNLLVNILSSKQKYNCKIKTIRFLKTLIKNRIEYDEFLDYMEIDEKNIFHDWEIQLYAIASSNRKNVAKMYYYFFNHMSEGEQDYFIHTCLEFESEVVSSRNFNFDENTHTEWIGIFFYDPKRDSEFQKKAIIPKQIEWNITYDFETQQLIIWKAYISFKTAKTQKTLIEFLVNNRHRHITLSELKWSWMRNIKQTLDDIRDKMEAKGVTVLERKMLFNYFTEKGEEYCRILL